MHDFAAVRFRQETTAPVIGAECFRVATRPNFHAAIADHSQLDAFAIYFAERLTEIVWRTAGPIEKNVDADEFFLRRLYVGSGGSSVRLFAFAVFPRLQDLRHLAQARDNSLRKLFRSDLLL